MKLFQPKLQRGTRNSDITGMMHHYFFTQTVRVYVGVYFRCGYFFMSKHTLDGTQVRSAFKQMSGERMAESMRTNGFFYPCHQGKFPDYIENHDPGQWESTPYAQEKIRFRTLPDVDMTAVRHI